MVTQLSSLQVIALDEGLSISNLYGHMIPGWRRKWQPTPVFLPGESQGQRSLTGYTVCGVARVVTSSVVFVMLAVG